MSNSKKSFIWEPEFYLLNKINAKTFEVQSIFGKENLINQLYDNLDVNRDYNIKMIKTYYSEEEIIAKCKLDPINEKKDLSKIMRLKPFKLELILEENQ